MVTDALNTLHIGDARVIIPTLPKESIQTVITSPPYFQLRDYGINGQIGQENTIEDYVDHLIDVFSKIMEPYGLTLETATQAAIKTETRPEKITC